MSLALVALIAVLFATGTYSMLSRSLTRIVVGIGLIGNGANLLLVVAGSRPGVLIGAPAGTTEYTDPHTGTTATWEYATWTSPVHQLAVPSTEVIASWNARTPAGTWIQIELQGTYSDDTATPWYVMGRWAAGDGDIKRTSVDDQTDDKSTVWTDTFAIDDPSTGLRLSSYRLRLTLYRKPGTKTTPTVWRLGAMGSDVPDRFTVPASAPGLAHELSVPRYSQEIHAGQYPEYDNGGEAWCSPTSSQMIVEYWGRGPSAADLKSLPHDRVFDEHGRKDGSVDWAAIHTYDKNYDGTGNWPFNSAYASHYGLDGTVRQYDSLQGLEYWVKRGVPAVVSIAWNNKSHNKRLHLDGADIDSTGGHLIVVRGFTGKGEVIANDPASPDNDAVRHVYRRDQFEFLWQHASAGVIYLIKPYRIAGKAGAPA
jgi:multisubunit Na+/H+ antiporter MnhC subunit